MTNTYRTSRMRKQSAQRAAPGVRALFLGLVMILTLGGLPIATVTPVVAQNGQMPASSMTGPGTYKVTATREGLVGGMTSSGHTIQPNDHFVSLPACTATSCPWLDPGELPERWGNRTECGDQCWVKVINEDTGSCEVAKVLDTGPWFTVDDWWKPTSERYLNSLETIPNELPQGVTGASAARNGLDVGYGIGPSGYGSSNRYATVGNASAIDLADGTWMALGLDFNKGIDVIDVELLWQTGASPAAEAASCGHPLDQSKVPGALSISPTSGEVGSSITVSASGFSGGEPVTLHAVSASSPAFATVTANGSGAISATVTMPDAPYGTNAIVAVGRNSGTDKRANFRVTPSIERSPTQGTVGSPVQFTVHGFGANESVRLTWDNASGGLITTIQTNNRGTGSATVSIPNRPSGWNTYYARGGTTQAGAFGAFNVITSSVSNPAGDTNTSFGGSNLPPVSSFGTGNGTGSTLVWDGDTSTSWYTTDQNPTSGGFTIDYGEVHDLTGVRWQMQTTGEADSFLVETSVDGSRWESVGTYGNAPVNAWRGEDLDRQGRYLRVTFGNPNGDSRLGGISEIELWGSDASDAPSTAPPGSNPTFSGSKLQIVSSSTTRTSIPGSRAYDGNLSTSWYTNTANPSEASLTLDLGSAREASGVKWTFSQEDGADSLTVTVSSNGTDWSTLGTSSNRQVGTWEGMAINQSVRYVRLIFTNPYGAESIGHVAEVEIWGSGAPGQTPPPASPTPYPGSNPSFSGSPLAVTSASSSALPAGQQTTAASRAVDGNLGTTWVTTGGNPEQAILTLDLGSVHSVSGVKWIYSESSGVDRQALQVSTDGSNWTQKVVTSWRQPMQWEGFGVNQDARYVRLVLTNASDLPVLGHIAEVQVWGTSASIGSPTATATATSTPSIPTEAIVQVLISVIERVISNSSQQTMMAAASTDAQEPIADATPTGGMGATPVAVDPTTTPTEEGSSSEEAAPTGTVEEPTGTPAGTPVGETGNAATPADSTESEEAVTETATVTQTEVATETATATETETAAETPVATETSTATATATASETATEAATEEPTEEATPSATEASPSATEATATETVTETPVTETPVAEQTFVPVEPWTGYVTGTNGESLNCRAEPSTDGEILAKLQPGTAVTVIGEPVDNWLPVRCSETDGWVSADFITSTPPTAEATVEPEFGADAIESEEVLEPTETTTTTPEATEVIEEETPTFREVSIPASSDFSMAESETESTASPGTLLVGGEGQNVAAMTFDISGIGDGTIVEAKLVVNGMEDGAGGNVIVLPGFWADPWSTSWAQLFNGGGSAGWLDWLSPGAASSVDLTGWVTGDGPVTVVIVGTTDQTAGIASQESGSPPTLILTIED